MGAFFDTFVWGACHLHRCLVAAYWVLHVYGGNAARPLVLLVFFCHPSTHFAILGVAHTVPSEYELLTHAAAEVNLLGTVDSIGPSAGYGPQRTCHRGSTANNLFPFSWLIMVPIVAVSVSHFRNTPCTFSRSAGLEFLFSSCGGVFHIGLRRISVLVRWRKSTW